MFESLAAGLAIGTSLPALINIGVRLLDLRSFQTAYIFPTLCILFWSFFDRKRPVLTIMPASEDDRDFRFIIATPFLAIVAWNPQAWPFCATYLLGTYFLYQKRIGKRITIIPSTRLFATPTILLISLIVNVVYRSFFHEKPLWHYFVGLDGAWDEGVAWSISQFGVKQNALFAGQSFRGHILTHAWAGDLATSTFSPDFLVTGIPGFAVGVLGASIAVYATSISLFTKRIVAIISILVLSIQASLPEELLPFPAPRYANSLSIFYLICAWCVLLNYPSWKIGKTYLVIFLSAAVVTLSKVHWGGVFVFSGVTLALGWLIRARLFTMLSFALVIMCAFFATYTFFIQGSGNVEEVQLRFSYTYLLSILIFVATRLFLPIFEKTSSALLKRLRVFYVANLLVTVIVVWTTNGQNNSFYLLHSLTFLASLPFAPLAYRIFSSNLLARRFHLMVSFFGISIGMGTTFIYLFAKNRLANDDNYPQFFWLFVQHPNLIQPLIFFGALILVAIFLFVAKPRNVRFMTLTLVPTILILVLGTNFGTWLMNPYRPAINNLWKDVDFNSGNSFTEGQLKTTEWIRLNTPKDSLIASNFQCSINVLSSPMKSKVINCATRNTLSWIAPLAKRKVLTEAIEWSGGAPNSTNYAIANNWIQLLDEFSPVRGDQSISDLRALGVDFLIMDKSRFESSSAGSFGQIVFETRDFCVFRLNS